IRLRLARLSPGGLEPLKRLGRVLRERAQCGELVPALLQGTIDLRAEVEDLLRPGPGVVASVLDGILQLLQQLERRLQLRAAVREHGGVLRGALLAELRGDEAELLLT